MANIPGMNFTFCSLECFKTKLLATLEELERQILQCHACTDRNPELHPRSSEGPATMPLNQINHRSKFEKNDRRNNTTGKVRNAKVCNMGKMTNNSFFNFVREVRKRCCGKRQSEIVHEAALQWRRMSEAEKNRFRHGTKQPGKNQTKGTTKRTGRITKKTMKPKNRTM